MSLICFQLYGAMTDSAINTWASHENGRRRHVIITSCGQRALSPHHVARDADRRVHRCGEGVLWWPARTYYRHARAKARAGLLLNHHGRMRSTSLCGAGAMHAACAGRQHVGQQMLGGWERRCAAADVAVPLHVETRALLPPPLLLLLLLPFPYTHTHQKGTPPPPVPCPPPKPSHACIHDVHVRAGGHQLCNNG